MLAGGSPLLSPHYVEAGDSIPPTPDLMVPHHPDLLNDTSRLRFDPEKHSSKGCENQPEGWITIHNRTGIVLMWGTTKLQPGEKKTLPKNHGDLVVRFPSTAVFFGKNCTKKKAAINLRITGAKPNTLPVQIIEGAYEGLKVDDWAVVINL